MERESYKMSREELLLHLCEPYETLGAEDLAEAQALARTDSEVALALKQCRGMSRLSDTAIFGGPQSSDAAFLVAFRERLSKSEESVVRPAFITRKLLALAGTVCVAAMAIIFAVGQNVTPPMAQTTTPQALENLALVLDPATSLVPDSISDSTVDAESLAVYLDVPEMASNWDFDTDTTTDQPLTDQLLSLDPETLQEVMNDLENTNFF